MKKVINKITGSRKFWFSFAAICLLCFSDVDANSIVLITLGLLISQGLSDRKCQEKCQK